MNACGRWDGHSTVMAGPFLSLSTYTSINNRPLVRLLPCPVPALALPISLKKRAGLVGERCTASRGTHHGDGRSAVQKKNPAMAWLYQWRRALPCLHLFVLLRKRDMGVRYAQPGTESSPLGPGTAQLIFLQGSR